MKARINNGLWGDEPTARRLQQRAENLGLDGAAFVEYWPGEFVNDRVWR